MFYHVDTDVCIYSTCAFLTVKWTFDVDNVHHSELVNILQGIALYKKSYYYYPGFLSC